LHVRNPSPHALGALMERPREHLTVRGTIIDDPIEEVSANDDARIWRMTLRAEEVNRIGHFQKTSGRIDIFWRAPESGERPSYGDQWTFSGVVQHREHQNWS